MITLPDFEKKQTIFVFANDGEKICLQNGNLIVKDADGKAKLQVSCFRLFLICIVGYVSITTALINEARKYGFSFALFSSGFRLYETIGSAKDGNTLLKKRQYGHSDLDIAKHIIKNKIATQCENLMEQRNKSEAVKEAILSLKQYFLCIDDAQNRNELMAYEGLASKIYFKNHFNNLLWNGRQPRVKKDWINSALDIGYTVLFSLMEALLNAYGFDIYIGVLHTQFYMRKSLVCDFVEPFRHIVDKTIKKCYNLREFQESDFMIVNHKYQLQWKLSSKYIKQFMNEILKYKSAIFLYVQQYYRCFMKNSDINKYPFYLKGTLSNGIDKL